MKTNTIETGNHRQMKIKRIHELAFIIMTLLIQAGAVKAQPQVQGFAVLELFTSEGCSNCPPAEALLDQIDQASKGQPVYLLAYHVDYFDRLGWKDPFGKHQYSLRQYSYGRNLSAQVYTPQLIVNGATEGIGSDEKYVRGAINNALSKASGASLNVQARIVQPERATGARMREGRFEYKVQGQTGGAILVIALVQKHAVSHVMRGENKGRTLTHSGIVSDLNSYNTGKSASGRVNFHLPADFNWEKYDLISFLQKKSTGEIIAANRVHGQYLLE